ncbi:hypothetical protein PENSOL_c033G00294 [Penicillium solitum]|uniref:Uncharacterized protein n=1 Tax=Penicillium solitum TaxID=60172 RepID=A0A1V6QWI9_9EURO|nr:uncharacterized protein PENSOL_c033G00294 [Penicillium solitum]OQD93356.1 hypothetical protein PENSOL_c033G00294 [Penicillium solitum]
MTPPLPPSNGSYQCQQSGANERNERDARDRQATSVEERQPRFRNSFPQPGDSPIYRAPVPLVPHALRYMNSALPLLVPPPEASPSILTSQKAEGSYATTTSDMSTKHNCAESVKSEDRKEVNDSIKKRTTWIFSFL